MPYADPAQQREYQRNWWHRRRADWIAQHGPCVDCGTWDDLEVDHAEAATKISHKVWSWTAHRREAELIKCVVRCNACHVAKTTLMGERPHGERHGSAKLTEDQVRAIRESTASCRVAAREFGVGTTAISMIRRRLRWQHVE